MNFKYSVLTFIYLISIASAINCNSPSEPGPDSIMSLTEPPTITGIFVTSLLFPDGTGEIIGQPAYTIKDINVFPNPYYEIEGHEINIYNRRITFTHLPEIVTIKIVRGNHPTQKNSTVNSVITGMEIYKGIEVVKTLEKNNSVVFLNWDIKDENGSYVLPGYYRAYIFSPQLPEYYWLDIAINDTIKNELRRF